MEIQGPGGISGPNRLEPQRGPNPASEPAGETSPVRDRVEISEQAKMLEKLSQVPAVRMDRIEELKRLIDAGEYETPERVTGAVERLLEEL